MTAAPADGTGQAADEGLLRERAARVAECMARPLAVAASRTAPSSVWARSDPASAAPPRRPLANMPSTAPTREHRQRIQAEHQHESTSWLHRALELAHGVIWAGSMERSERERWSYLRFLAWALEAAQRWAERSGRPLPTVYVFHHPQDSLRARLGIKSRDTFRAYLRDWTNAGLIDFRSHVTEADVGPDGGWGGRRRVTDGTVYAVKLDPRRNPSTPARLRRHDLAHQGYRDLEADRAAGRTAHAELDHLSPRKPSQSLTLRRGARSRNPLVEWSLPPGRVSLPLQVTDYVLADASAMLELPHLRRRDRGPAVDRAARAIARELNDAPNLGAYRQLLWDMLRRHDEGVDYFHAVHTQILRVRGEIPEGYPRRPGALLTGRLKSSGLWDKIKAGAPRRVGLRPRSCSTGSAADHSPAGGHGNG